MADNVELDPGTGGAVIAGDDIGGVIYPRSKITLGADAVNDGDISSSNPMPVKGTGTAGTANAGVVTVQGIASMTPVQVGDNSTSLTVDAPVATPVFVRLSDGSDPITQLDVNIAGLAANLFAHTEDTASANAHVGVGSMAVRKAAPANTSDTDGDYEFLQMSGGRLWVSAVLDTELPAGTQAIGKLAVNNGVDIGDVTINNSNGANAVHIQDGGNSITVDGTVTATLAASVTEDSPSAGGETLVLVGGTRNDSAVSQTSQNGDYGTIAIDAAGRIGIADLGGAITVDNGGTFAVQATLQAGSASVGILGANSGVDIGDVTINNAGGGSAVNIQDGGNVITVDGTVTANISAAVIGCTAVYDTNGNSSYVMMAGAVRNDSAVSMTSGDGYNSYIACDSAGRIGVCDLGGTISVDNGGTFAVQATLQAGSASFGILGANSGVDIGDVTINNSTGGSAVNIQDGGNTITVDAPVATPVYVRLSDGASAITTLPVSLASVPSHAVTNAGTFAVQESGSHIQVDDAAFTPATSKICMIGAEVDETGTDSVDEGDGGAVRMSTNRNMYVRIRDNAGNERGLNIDANGEFQISGSRNAIAVTDNSSSLSVDWAGTAPVTGSGTSTGALRVELPTNGTGTVGLNAGTNNIGDVDVLSIAAGTNNIGNVGLIPRTSGGLTIYRNLDVDETEDEIKGSAGQLYWIHAMNMSNAPLYLKFWNATAANVTVGTTTPVLTLPLPTQGNTNGAGTQINIPQGLVFDTAMTVGATTGVLDNSTGAPGTNEVIINLGYA